MAKHDKEKKMNKTVSYDQENDILVIHKGFLHDEKFKANMDLGDLILDISTKGKIAGIEIINATRFFKEFNMDYETLKNITDAQFSATMQPNSIIIGIKIKSKGCEIPAKIAVPLRTSRL